MAIVRELRGVEWLKACALWLLLGASLGMYYLATYPTHSGWPVPSAETAGAALAYVFAAAPEGPVTRAVLWLVFFPLAGMAWSGLLAMASAYYEGRGDAPHQAAGRFSVAALPLIVPLPYLVYAAGAGFGGWNWRGVTEFVQRQHEITPWAGLNTLYVALAVAALAWHGYALRTAFPVPPRRILRHVAVTLLVFLPLMAGIGVLTGRALSASGWHLP